MDEMKTLANCSTREFLVQTNKMRFKVERFIKLLDLKKYKDEIISIKNARNGEKKIQPVEIVKMLYPIFSDILTSCFETDIDLTFEIVALATFQTVEDVEKMQPNEIIEIFNAIISSKRVIDFFTSSAKLAGSVSGIISSI